MSRGVGRVPRPRSPTPRGRLRQSKKASRALISPSESPHRPRSLHYRPPLHHRRGGDPLPLPASLPEGVRDRAGEHPQPRPEQQRERQLRVAHRVGLWRDEVAVPSSAHGVSCVELLRTLWWSAAWSGCSPLRVVWLECRASNTPALRLRRQRPVDFCCSTRTGHSTDMPIVENCRGGEGRSRRECTAHGGGVEKENGARGD